MSENEVAYSLKLLNVLRLCGYITEIDANNRKLANNFKQADRLNAKYIIIIGEDEVKTNKLTIKNNHTKEEHKVNLRDLVDFFDQDNHECTCDGGCCHEN